jgi:hypothetical protein
LGRFEAHHILPKSFDSTCLKDKDNLVFVSTREHFVLHYLLTKMFTKGSHHYHKMMTALNCFSLGRRKTILKSKEIAIALLAKHSPCSETRRQNIKSARKNTPKIECPHCGGFFDPGNYLQYHGDKCRHNPTVDKQVLLDRSNKSKKSYLVSLEKGTHVPFKPIIGEFKCPHCEKVGTNFGSMQLYHFDRCKHNPNRTKEYKEWSMPLVCCIHCRVEVNLGNLAKRHGDNCKLAPNSLNTLPLTFD